jgi:Zn-dependent peptidase ImmA (M78 family)/DNA-binding XRE family transcriptional regulator
MTKKSLAEALGVTDRSVTAFEAGEFPPSEANLPVLAKVLGFPESFFFQEDLEELRAESVSFRALSSMTAGKRDAALSAGAFAVALNTYLESKFALPGANVPDYRGHDPEAAAMALRAHWSLGELPIKNVIHLLEAQGIRVFSLVEECHDVDAYSLWKDGTPFIFLNTMKSAERSRFDAAHELGHLVLHRHGQPAGKEPEREADAFASAFLMPRGSILAHPIAYPTLSNLVVAKRSWGVSVAALTYRLKQLNQISEWTYRTLFKEISMKGWRKSEPNEGPRESSLLLAKVLAALKEEGVSKQDLARHLHLRLADLEKFVFGLVMVAVPGGRIEEEKQATGKAPRPDWKVL